jgi:hydrogenase 3 maturation protease
VKSKKGRGLDDIESILSGKVVVVGIGNTMRGDDGFGSELVRRLQGRIDAVCIDAGSAPENYLGSVVKEKPDTLLLLDAVHMGMKPGDFRIMKPEEILDACVSTHDISLSMLVDFIMEVSDCKVYLLGLQPKTVEFGKEISEGVAEAIDTLEEALISGIPGGSPPGGSPSALAPGGRPSPDGQ